MPLVANLPYQLRVLLCTPAQNEPGRRYAVPPEQLKEPTAVWNDRGGQLIPVVKREAVGQDVNYEPLFKIHGKEIKVLRRPHEAVCRRLALCGFSPVSLGASRLVPRGTPLALGLRAVIVAVVAVVVIVWQAVIHVVEDNAEDLMSAAVKYVHRPANNLALGCPRLDD